MPPLGKDAVIVTKTRDISYSTQSDSSLVSSSARSLEIEDAVYVMGFSPRLTGVVKYMGETLERGNDTWVGIRLTCRSMGKGHSDGAWKGVRYFICEPMDGIFVKEELVVKRRLTKLEELRSRREISTQVTKNVTFAKKNIVHRGEYYSNQNEEREGPESCTRASFEYHTGDHREEREDPESGTRANFEYCTGDQIEEREDSVSTESEVVVAKREKDLKYEGKNSERESSPLTQLNEQPRELRPFLSNDGESKHLITVNERVKEPIAKQNTIGTKENKKEERVSTKPPHQRLEELRSLREASCAQSSNRIPLKTWQKMSRKANRLEELRLLRKKYSRPKQHQQTRKDDSLITPTRSNRQADKELTKQSTAYNKEHQNVDKYSKDLSFDTFLTLKNLKEQKQDSTIGEGGVRSNQNNKLKGGEETIQSSSNTGGKKNRDSSFSHISVNSSESIEVSLDTESHKSADLERFKDLGRVCTEQLECSGREARQQDSITLMTLGTKSNENVKLQSQSSRSLPFGTKGYKSAELERLRNLRERLAELSSKKKAQNSRSTATSQESISRMASQKENFDKMVRALELKRKECDELRKSLEESKRDIGKLAKHNEMLESQLSRQKTEFVNETNRSHGIPTRGAYI